jgi:hypothetical protein
MSGWIFYPLIVLMVLFGMQHFEHRGYVRGMTATAQALEPHICK